MNHSYKKKKTGENPYKYDLQAYQLDRLSFSSSSSPSIQEIMSEKIIVLGTVGSC